MDKVTAPMESINRIDPNLMAIAIILLAFLAIVFMFIFMPRIDRIKKIENDRDVYKAQRDYYINAYTVELIKSGRTEEAKAIKMAEYDKKITKKEHIAKQASKRSRIFAALGDELRRQANV